MAETVALLANPRAGRGRGARLAAPVRAALTGAGLDVLVLAGDSAESSTELAAEAVAAGVDAVVAVGGDGLVQCAIQALAGSAVPLGIVPAGGGNDLAGSLGLPADPVAAVAVVAAGRTRTIDLGRTEGRSEGRTEDGRWWATVLCAGFDSEVARRAERMRWPRGPRRYDLATYLELARLRPRPFRLTLDGEQVNLDVTLVAVGNGPRYGGGLLICPGAVLDDGLLDVTVGGPVSRLTLARLKPLVRTGRHVEHPSATVFRASRVVLDAPGLLAYADGERMGPLPVATTCVPAALRVFTP